LGAAAASAVANFEWFMNAVVVQNQCALNSIHVCLQH